MLEEVNGSFCFQLTIVRVTYEYGLIKLA